MRRERKGAIAVLSVMLVTLFIMFGAFAVDYAHLMAMRAQLRSATDAGALAGAMQLLQTNRAAYKDSARSFALKNVVEDKTIVVNDADIVYGVWDTASRRLLDRNGTFANATAVEVTASIPTQYYLANIFGAAPKSIVATSTAWAGASVGTSNCVKPWSLPYQALLQAVGETADFTRDLTKADIDKLTGSTPKEFILKHSDQTGNPGDYYIVDMPPLWHWTSETTGERGNPIEGGKEYERLAGECSSSPVGARDTLQVEPGVKAGPTVQGFQAFCESDGGGFDVSSGMCYADAAKTQYGKPAIVPLWTGTPQGRSDAVIVKVLGNFVINRIYNDKGANYITGHFVGLNDPTGKIGPRETILKKLMLVR